LSIAYDSLSNYLDPLLTEWEGLQGRAKAELQKQYELLKDSPGDMVLLGKITVLDVLAKRREKEKEKDRDRERERERSGDTEGSTLGTGAAGVGGIAGAGAGAGAGATGKKEEERTMASYVNASKMEQVRETCRVTHGTSNFTHRGYGIVDMDR
jgi:hypothetical protein